MLFFLILGSTHVQLDITSNNKMRKKEFYYLSKILLSSSPFSTNMRGKNEESPWVQPLGSTMPFIGDSTWKGSPFLLATEVSESQLEF